MLENASLLLVEEKFYDQNVVALITHSILDQIRLPGCVLESSWWADSETLIFNPISPRFVGENNEIGCCKVTDYGCRY